MPKFVRSSALVVALTLAAVPAVRADRTGCNPHPQIAAPSALSIFVYTVLSALGI